MSADTQPRRRNCGFTLLEAIIAAAIAAAILGAAMHDTLYSAVGTEVVRSNLFVRVDNAIRRIATDFERGELDLPGAAGDTLAYQLPVDPDGDGSFLDASGAIQWGILDNGVPIAGGKATLRFVADDVLDEEALSVDLNGDGDKKDRFDHGHLERVLPDGSIERLTGAWILQPNGNHGADLDNDGLADPIFSLDTSGQKTLANVSLTIAVPLAGRNWMVERVAKTFLCQNDKP
jgi:hypothetical protein